MKKAYLHLFFWLLAGLLPYSSWSQIPSGYYDPANGLTGQPLQAALHNIIKNHTVVSYSSLWTYFQSTDKKSNGTVWDMYSDVPGGTPPYTYQFGSDQCGNYSGEGDCYNREHSWPKSWFGDIAPMNCDIFHIYPTDGYVNGRRDNYPYGEVSSATWTSLNGSKLGTCVTPGYSGVVFEPLDSYKGDFARTYFYMSVRYYTEDGGWPGSPMTTGAQLKPWALAMMLQWSEQDPVSQKEIDRNNYVYNQVQHNRNPFIDHPEYAEAIWGTPSSERENHKTAELNVFPIPATSTCSIIIPTYQQTATYSLKVLSTQGVAYKVPVKQAGDLLQADVESLPKGFYLLILTDVQSKEICAGKMIKN